MLAWLTSPTCARAAAPSFTGIPFTRTVPCPGASKPASIRRSVVFPAPLGPNSARQSPPCRVKLTSSTARRPLKVRTRPSACTTGLFSAVEETALEWAGAEGGIRGRYRRAARRERAEPRLPDPLNSFRGRKSTAGNCFGNPPDLSEGIQASEWPATLPAVGLAALLYSYAFTSGWRSAFGMRGRLCCARRASMCGLHLKCFSWPCAQLVAAKDRWPLLVGSGGGHVEGPLRPEKPAGFQKQSPAVRPPRDSARARTPAASPPAPVTR